jgi:hypothetical protein
MARMKTEKVTISLTFTDLIHLRRFLYRVIQDDYKREYDLVAREYLKPITSQVQSRIEEIKSARKLAKARERGEHYIDGEGI